MRKTERRRAKKLPHIAFNNFRDVTHILARFFMEERGRTNVIPELMQPNLLHAVGEIE